MSEEVRELPKELFGDEPWDLQKFITETNRPFIRDELGIDLEYELWLRPHIICGNGKRISVQASSIHYCEPRETLLEKYDSYEVLFFGEWDFEEMLRNTKSKKEHDAIEYFIEHDCEISYGDPLAFVPHDILQNFIAACGGILSVRHRRIL